MADPTPAAERTSIPRDDEQQQQQQPSPPTTSAQSLLPPVVATSVTPSQQQAPPTNWFFRIAGPPVAAAPSPAPTPSPAPAVPRVTLRTQMTNTATNQFPQPTAPPGHQLPSSTEAGVSIASPNSLQATNPGDFPVLRLECRTWSRDSHELYDYESASYHERGYYIRRSARVFRHGTEIFVLPDNAELPTTGEFLVSVKPRDNRYYVFPADKSTVSGSSNVNVRKLWLITKYLKNRRYALQENDVVKLGRFKLRIRQVVTDSNADIGIDYKLDDRENYSAEELSQEQAESTQCRICLLEGAEENDPLIRACKCKGSIMYVHLECLRHWVNGRLNLSDDSNRTCCFVRQLPCELCKETFPSFVLCRGKKVSIVKIPKIDPPFIVLENMVGPANRGLHLCSLSAKKECKLGRGHESDVRIADVSISRWHATIKFMEGRFQLEDQTSKFGTLVALRHPLMINDDLSVQVGRTVLKFSVVDEVPNMKGEIMKLDTRQEAWSGKLPSLPLGVNPPSEGGSGNESGRQPLPLGGAGGGGAGNTAALDCRTRGFYVPIRPQSEQQEDEPAPHRLPAINPGAPAPCGVCRVNELDFAMDWVFAEGASEGARQPAQRQQFLPPQPTLTPTVQQQQPAPNVLALRFVQQANGQERPLSQFARPRAVDGGESDLQQQLVEQPAANSPVNPSAEWSYTSVAQERQVNVVGSGRAAPMAEYSPPGGHYVAPEVGGASLSLAATASTPPLWGRNSMQQEPPLVYSSSAQRVTSDAYSPPPVYQPMEETSAQPPAPPSGNFMVYFQQSGPQPQPVHHPGQQQ